MTRKFRSSKKIGDALFLLLCALLAGFPLLAFAGGPQNVAYQGRLTENGAAVTGTKAMVFNIYDAATGGNLLFSNPSQNITIVAGVFSVSLDFSGVAVEDQSQLFVEIIIDGTTLSPRDPVAAVPYAISAQALSGASTISASGFMTFANLASPPSPAKGRIYFDASGQLRVSLDGVGFVTLATGTVGSGNFVARTGDIMTGDLQIGGATASTFAAAGFMTIAGISQPAATSGRIYFDSTSNKLRIYPSASDGWVDIATGTISGVGDILALSTLTVAASLVLPTTSATPVVATSGEIVLNTAKNTLIIHDGTAARVFGADVSQVTVTILFDGLWDNETLPIWNAPKDFGVTIIQIDAAVLGSGTPSLTYNIEERLSGGLASAGTDIYAADQAADADGELENVFTNATIAPKAHLVFTTATSAATGTVDAFTATIYYRKNAL